MIIGACGFIGSGKGTFGEYLVTNRGWKSASFAKSLKDMVSVVFHWPRELLEGDTKESREWRETIDTWWTKKLGKTITPRWVLQNIGTDVMRNHFADDIWVLSLERVLSDTDENVIVTDVRFPNEVKTIRSMKGGQTVWIRRGELPEWYDLAHAANSDTFLHAPECYDDMVKLGIHQSEWAWVGQTMDHVIYNDGTLSDLHADIDRLILNIEKNR
jgi:hypothetical protein